MLDPLIAFIFAKPPRIFAALAIICFDAAALSSGSLTTALVIDGIALLVWGVVEMAITSFDNGQ